MAEDDPFCDFEEKNHSRLWQKNYNMIMTRKDGRRKRTDVPPVVHCDASQNQSVDDLESDPNATDSDATDSDDTQNCRTNDGETTGKISVAVKRNLARKIAHKHGRLYFCRKCKTSVGNVIVEVISHYQNYKGDCVAEENLNLDEQLAIELATVQQPITKADKELCTRILKEHVKKIRVNQTEDIAKQNLIFIKKKYNALLKTRISEMQKEREEMEQIGKEHFLLTTLFQHYAYRCSLDPKASFIEIDDAIRRHLPQVSKSSLNLAVKREDISEDVMLGNKMANLQAFAGKKLKVLPDLVPGANELFDRRYDVKHKMTLQGGPRNNEILQDNEVLDIPFHPACMESGSGSKVNAENHSEYPSNGKQKADLLYCGGKRLRTLKLKS